MKKRFSDEQSINILREVGAIIYVREIRSKHATLKPRSTHRVKGLVVWKSRK